MKRTQTKGFAMLIAGLMTLSIIAAPKVALAAEKILMGTAGNFAVLAGQTITNSGPTSITGDVGLHPGSAFTGQADVDLSGSIHLADAVALKAQADLLTAYDQAAGMAEETIISSELGGTTLKPGVYVSESGEFQITGVLTLDAQGDSDAVFVFKTATTLVTASASEVAMINGANLCNVYWKVGSSATLGSNSFFAGRILAHTSIALNTEAKVKGQLLAMHGSVTLLSNTITISPCGYKPTTQITGTKKWVGGSSRPTIGLQLYRNDEAYLAPENIVSPATAHTWSGLDKKDEAGADYVYRVDETNVPADYAKSISADGLTVTNTYTASLIDVTGEKTWVDQGGRPDTITVNLVRNGSVVDSREVSAGTDGKWSYRFLDLPETNSSGTAYQYTISEQPVTGYVPVINGFDIVNRKIKGSIVFSKQDELGKGLAGATFGLYAPADTAFSHPVRTAKSGTAGKVKFSGVEYGTYQIREISAPAGYVKSKTALMVTIDKDGQTVSPGSGILVNKKIMGSVIIRKYDEAHHPLAGAEFTLSHDGVPVGKPKLSDADGRITFENIPYGTYSVKETKAPADYVLSTAAKTVKIRTNGAAVTADFTNVRSKGEILILKVAKGTDKPLAGAQFKAADKDGEKVFEGTTGADGLLSFQLPIGQYTISEIKAPKGYRSSGKSFSVKITENGEIVKKTVENEIETVSALPPTGESSRSMAYTLGGLFIAAGLFLLKKKRA